MIAIVVCVGVVAAVAAIALGFQRPWGGFVVGAVAGVVAVSLVSRAKPRRS